MPEAFITLSLPNDKHERLKTMARRRGTSVNRLIEEMVMLTLAEFDAKTHFLARAVRSRGKTSRGVALLAKALRSP